MTPSEVCRTVYAAGLTVHADAGELVLRPASRLTPALRELLLTHKPALITFLKDAEQTAGELVAAAMAACDHHGDNTTAREAMRQDCMAIPPHQRQDLLAHFQQTYPRGNT